MRFRHLLSAMAQRLSAPEKTAVEHYRHVEVFEWRPKSGAINFGDHLSTVVVSKVLAGRDLSLWEETPAAHKLFAIGSVLHFATEGSVVWGSGINGKIPTNRPYPTILDIRAVRGPLTAQFLKDRGHEVPEVYGDPALLLPTLFPARFLAPKKAPVVFVPNLHDLGTSVGPIPTISPLRGWNWVVDRIAEAELVLASSLHGLIIAEALGIPARYIRLSENEGLFKYDDYAQGTGRPGIEAAGSIEEGLEMGGLAPIRFDPQPLLNAFPWDLWRA